MDKSKLFLPICILLGCISLGGFVFASQVIKNQSIERQQQVKIDQENQAQASKDLKEGQDKAVAEQALVSCISVAEKRWRDWAKQVIALAEECKVKGGGTCGTIKAYTEALQENDAEHKKDTADCYARYPQ